MPNKIMKTETNELNAEEIFADALDRRGPFIPSQDLEVILARETEQGHLHQYASGVLAARRAA